MRHRQSKQMSIHIPASCRGEPRPRDVLTLYAGPPEDELRCMADALEADPIAQASAIATWLKTWADEPGVAPRVAAELENAPLAKVGR